MSESYSMSDFTKMVNAIVDQVLELSLLYDCRAYLLVESDNGIVIFNSVEDPLWPPDDRSLRLYSSWEILARAIGEERKDLIQLLVYISEVAKGPLALAAESTQDEQALGAGAFEGPRADEQDEDRIVQEEDNADDEKGEGDQRAVENAEHGEEGRGHETYIWSGDATDWYGSKAQLQ
ncbi:hypothetical protein P170DRAFT_425791 [Aspergillus steynii IBT 23096]|uniref:Uncharacterized protein n=1 Tax=Aspergillus steynii IBT 23096 TaxID=1392250 RepID=A0A2I2G7B6_9EURO|nr:uncharacterized protein P170DRAFT_425791 [Aspergillus steynii IBT 23096]PLB48772.1 hypothetical protein P170DRAFT_425791 [Aspergillus steynii IBT 23096]